MPGDNGLWFDDDQDVVPCRPEPTEKYPKQPILDAQPRARTLSLQYAELLAKGQDLKAEAVPGTEEAAEAGEGKMAHDGLQFIAYGASRRMHQLFEYPVLGDFGDTHLYAIVGRVQRYLQADARTTRTRFRCG